MPCVVLTKAFAKLIAVHTHARRTGGQIRQLRQRKCHSSLRSRTMNWDTVKGDWKQFRGKIKEQWGKLTDDDLDRIEGKRDQLLGAVQKRYGLARDEAD